VLRGQFLFFRSQMNCHIRIDYATSCISQILQARSKAMFDSWDEDDDDEFIPKFQDEDDDDPPRRWRRRRPAAFSAGKFSLYRYRPSQPAYENAKWEKWKPWAQRNGILDKHGNPSYKKWLLLVKRHELSAMQFKNRIWTAPRFEEQLDWTPEDWQALYKVLFSKSQANKARGKRKK
jgi:hypothetical protein